MIFLFRPPHISVSCADVQVEMDISGDVVSGGEWQAQAKGDVAMTVDSLLNLQGSGTIKSERSLTHNIPSPLFTAPLRSPARLQNTFAHECFMDELATRAKLRARQKIQQNRFVIVAAGAVVFALLIFAVVSAPRMSVPRSGGAQKSSRNAANGNQDAQSQAMASLGDKSLLPITDSGRPVPKESHDGI